MSNLYGILSIVEGVENACISLTPRLRFTYFLLSHSLNFTHALSLSFPLPLFFLLPSLPPPSSPSSLTPSIPHSLSPSLPSSLSLSLTHTLYVPLSPISVLTISLHLTLSLSRSLYPYHSPLNSIHPSPVLLYIIRIASYVLYITIKATSIYPSNTKRGHILNT